MRKEPITYSSTSSSFNYPAVLYNKDFNVIKPMRGGTENNGLRVASIRPELVSNIFIPTS